MLVWVPQVPIELNAGHALGIEVLCTFQLVFTVFSVLEQRRRDSTEPGNLAIGMAHTAGVLIGVSLERRYSGPVDFPCTHLQTHAGHVTLNPPWVRWE